MLAGTWHALAQLAQQPVTPMWVIIAGVLAGFVAIVGGLGGLGAAVYKLAKPQVVRWLQTQVVAPLQDTHHQVRHNGGHNDPATMRDNMAGIAERLNAIVAALRRNGIHVDSEDTEDGGGEWTGEH